MVKPSRALAEAQAEADVPYEETRLARRAPRARRRLVAILVAGALATLAGAALASSLGWALVALALAATAWGVRRAGLGGLVSAALAAMLAVMLPLRLVFLGVPDAATWALVGGSAALGVAAVPDVVTLIRDAELQHAYGVWAKRDPR